MKLVDLSHPLKNLMSTYPTDPDCLIIKEKTIIKNNSLLHSFTMGTHTGTHVDAAAHIIPNGKTLDGYPIESFSGKTIKLNKNNYHKLETSDKSIKGVIYDTNFYQNFDDPVIFYGKDRPVIPMDLIKKIIGMEITFFGSDLPSVDSSLNKDKPIHNMILSSNILIYESLTNLNQLQSLTPFNFYGYPLNFLGLDGSPVRAIASLY